MAALHAQVDLRAVSERRLLFFVTYRYFSMFRFETHMFFFTSFRLTIYNNLYLSKYIFFVFLFIKTCIIQKKVVPLRPNWEIV